MAKFKQFKQSQQAWITSGIGWLSLGIIAAAWGNRLLPRQWQDHWGSVGAFGLAAALSLAWIAAAKRRAEAPAD